MQNRIRLAAVAVFIIVWTIVNSSSEEEEEEHDLIGEDLSAGIIPHLESLKDPVNFLGIGDNCIDMTKPVGEYLAQEAKTHLIPLLATKYNLPIDDIDDFVNSNSQTAAAKIPPNVRLKLMIDKSVWMYRTQALTLRGWSDDHPERCPVLFDS